MRDIFVMVIMFSQVLSHASDSLMQNYIEVRTAANQAYSSMSLFGGKDCSETVLDHFQSEAEQCGERLSSSELAKMEKFLKSINMKVRERQFLNLARNEQLSAMQCEIDLLEGLGGSSIGLNLYGMVLKDICDKLPELRKRQANMNKLQAEVDTVDNLINPPGKNFGNYFFKKQREKWITKREGLLERFREQQSLFETIKSSTWRYGDPVMLGFIHEAINDDQIRRDICIGGGEESNASKIMAMRKRFWNKVVEPMVLRVKEDRKSLGVSVSDLGPKQVDMLLIKSNWEDYFRSGSTPAEDEMLMCHINQRYLDGDKKLSSALGTATFGLGGPFLFLKTARLFRLISKLNKVKTPRWANYLVLTSGTPYSINFAADSCTEPENSYDLKAPACPRLANGKLDIEQAVTIEKTKLRHLNCLLGATIGVISPTLAYVLDKSF